MEFAPSAVNGNLVSHGVRLFLSPTSGQSTGNAVTTNNLPMDDPRETTECELHRPEDNPHLQGSGFN